MSGGVPGHRGGNQHTARQRGQEVRGQLIGQLEGVADDLKRMLEAARESEGGPRRCTACGSFIPGVSKLKLGDILAARGVSGDGEKLPPSVCHRRRQCFTT